ncbi:MAG: hypothetical protein ACYSR0_12465 [Planctomycetota bacterium]
MSYEKRKNAEDQEFHVLVLQGGIELIKSSESGNYYASAKRATITCTFDERMCRQLIGSKLPGKVERVVCEPYEFSIPGTDEKLQLNHTFKYSPEPATAEEHVYQEEMVEA